MSSEDEQSNEYHGGLTAPRFSLRTLFWVMFLICVLFAILNRMSATGAVLAGVTILAVGAHVLANAVGTHLMKRTENVRHQSRLTNPNDSRPSVPAREHFAVPTKLSQKAPLGWPVVVATIIGALVGAVVSAIIFIQQYSNRIGYGGIAVGSISGLLLGGLWGFWIWSLAHVAVSAWWHAQREVKK